MVAMNLSSVDQLPLPSQETFKSAIAWNDGEGVTTGNRQKISFKKSFNKSFNYSKNSTPTKPYFLVAS